jgi:hypothetical protein
MSIMQFTLSPQQARDILSYLGVEPAKAGLGLLDLLVDAYGRRVPWESASRIVRREQVADTAACPRWPPIFWDDAQARGTGGTCFESNLAFFALLEALGFEGYLTINNMMETIGCHTAIVAHLEGQPYLVDAGYPVLCPVPLDQRRPVERATPYLTYTVTPLEPQRYLVENRPHPRPYMFHLIDQPVAEGDYLRATADDYGPRGLFLDRVIIRKVVDGDVWRFDGNVEPYVLEQFRGGQRIEHPLDHDPAAQLGAHFGIDAPLVREALALAGRRRAAQL